jgi:IclR family transcriptional regulator, KDG regulon repressor
LATTVMKAFHLLEYIGNNQPVQPAQIVEGLGFSRANVHRLLATFQSLGYVEKTGGGYGLSFKLFKLGSSVPLSRDLRDVAKPIMIELMRKAEENSYLTVLVEDMVIAIDEVKSSHHLTLNPDVTYSYPIYSCASGKIFLSALLEEERRRVAEGLEYRRLAKATIRGPEELLRAVEETERRGFATEIREFSDDLNSIAAPIYDYRKKIVATISISGPSMRLTEERMKELEESLLDTSKRISQRLGRNAE